LLPAHDDALDLLHVFLRRVEELAFVAFVAFAFSEERTHRLAVRYLFKSGFELAHLVELVRDFVSLLHDIKSPPLEFLPRLFALLFLLDLFVMFKSRRSGSELLLSLGSGRLVEDILFEMLLICLVVRDEGRNSSLSDQLVGRLWSLLLST